MIKLLLKNKGYFMKRKLATIIALTMGCVSLLSGCQNGGHTHTFDQKKQDSAYFLSESTCQVGTQYYYSCSCGKAGTNTFEIGKKRNHDYTAEVAEDKYLKESANCKFPAVYYKSCTMCGQKGYDFQTFKYGDLENCDYSQEVVKDKYLKDKATFETAAVYYKSCVCGAVGTETFTYGTALKELTETEKLSYMPTSLTVTLYDSENSVYGFTWNTEKEPLCPVIQIQKGNDLTNDCQEVAATVTKESSYDENDKLISYYIVKANVQLDGLETYTYRAYDKYADIGTAQVTLQTKDTKSTSFTFAHVSDSQTDATTKTGKDSGDYFGQTLSQIVGSNDFIVHTGDVVEYSKYEGYWKAMLNDNFSYLSAIPMMALSGNHETTYRNGLNETFKHFNYKIPSQASTLQGFFYSFVYGNTKFIMLNTNDVTSNKLKDEQYNWLVNELKNNTATWTIVGMHCPMYSIGQWGANPDRNAPSLALRNQLQGLFAQYGVDIVLQGHDHLISRTYPINATGVAQTETWETVNGVQYSIDPSGVIYVMNGPAGNQSEKPIYGTLENYMYGQKANQRSWAEFTIEGNTMKVIVKYYTGTETKTYHSWGIVKSH